MRGRVSARVHLDLSHPSSSKKLPTRFVDLHPRPPCLTIEGVTPEAERVIAIVGTRHAGIGTIEGTRALARACVARGAVVASGGALGLDGAAHEGALDAGGITWAILPGGWEHPSPATHKPLFRRILECGGTLVWGAPPNTQAGVNMRPYFDRNAILAGIADAVIIVQCPVGRSGTKNTAMYARERGKPIWMVPPTPWLDGKGALQEVELGAQWLYDLDDVFRSLEEPPAAAGPRTDPGEQLLLDLLGSGPQHTDELVKRSGLTAPAVSRALLTLSLDSVVVDGPDGRYRRCR
jgi:DNA processing protein